jgi:hypothetical protein
MAARITEERARNLLKQCKVSLIVSMSGVVALLATVGIMGGFDKASAIAWLTVLTYWLAAVYFLITIGRLAYGLERSVVYYVGGTIICTGAIFLFAHLIAYFNIKKAVSTTFAESHGTKPAAV